MSFLESLHIHPLSDHEIEQQQYSLSDLWLIKDDISQEVYGPFATSTLKSVINQYHIMHQTHICSLKTEKWDAFYENKTFSFYKLKYIKDKKEQHYNSKDLPFAPEIKTESSEISSHQNIHQMRRQKEEEDAIVGLAFVSSGNDKGQKLRDAYESDSSNTHEVSNHLTSHSQQDDANEFLKNLLEKIQEIKTQYNLDKVAVGFVLAVIVGGIFNRFNQPNLESTFSKNNLKKDIKVVERNIASTPVKKEQPKQKTFQPIKRKKKTTITKPVNPTPRYENRYVEKEDTYSKDIIDIDDPRVREEISEELLERDIAGYDDVYVEPNQIEAFINDEPEQQFDNANDQDDLNYQEISDFE